MDRDDDNEDDDQEDRQSQQRLPIRKGNITRYFGKTDKTIKFISCQNRVNLVKQKLKILVELNKSRFTISAPESKIRIDWKPIKESKSTITIQPFNSGRQSSLELQSKYDFSTGLKASLNINTLIEGNLKFGYKNSFHGLSYKLDLEFQKKKDLATKWAFEVKKKFRHQLWPNYLSGHHSRLEFKCRDWKPELKLATMTQTTNDYKFFTEVKLSKARSIDGKVNLQVEAPKGNHILTAEIKKPLLSDKPLPFSYEFRYLCQPYRGIKFGFSINEKRQSEAIYQHHQRVPYLKQSELNLSLSNRNAMLKLSGKKGKVKFELAAQMKLSRLAIPLIGVKFNYNVQYQKPYRKSNIDLIQKIEQNTQQNQFASQTQTET